MSRPIVTLFTRPACCICHPVKYVINKVATRVPLQYKEVNIDEPEHSKWKDMYTNDIPVIHVNGQEIARHRLNEPQLIEALNKASTTESK